MQEVSYSLNPNLSDLDRILNSNEFDAAEVRDISNDEESKPTSNKPVELTPDEAATLAALADPDAITPTTSDGFTPLPCDEKHSRLITACIVQDEDFCRYAMSIGLKPQMIPSPPTTAKGGLRTAEAIKAAFDFVKNSGALPDESLFPPELDRSWFRPIPIRNRPQIKRLMSDYVKGCLYKQYPELAYEESNLQPICLVCHLKQKER